MRSQHIALFAMAFVASCVLAAPDSLRGVGDVKLKGYLGARLDSMIERHVVAQDVEYITAPFKEKTERYNRWHTEFWGKWMHSAVPYQLYLGSGDREKGKRLAASVDRGVDEILATQEESGYIGNYPDELRCGEGWDVWGMKYTMMGLLHYYDATQSQRALTACCRLCDYVIAEIGPNGKRGRELWQTGNWSGYASSSILEPVVWLYKRLSLRQDLGGEAAAQKYLNFASYIVKGMVEPESGPRLVDLALKGVSVADRNGYGNKAETHGGYVMKRNRWKSYEMMSCYQGLLEYCEVVNKVGLRQAAIMAAEEIVKEEINLAGGAASSEAWFHGARKQHLPYTHLQETCVTTTWMRFCEKLLDVTGDPKWADQLERTFYNAYLGALRRDGSEFSAYTPLSGSRWHGMHHCDMHTDCCTSNGPRGFLCFLKKFFRVLNGAAEFNFYGSALVKGETADGRKVAFDMYSLYPRSDKARIVSHTEGVGVLPLRLRVPAWSAKTEISLNGKPLAGAKPGSYFTIEREWKFGDVIDVKFDMSVVAHALDHHLAFTRGPILLARDSRFADGDMMEPFRRAIEDGQKMDSFAAVRVPSDGMWMAFSATLPIGSHHENPEAALPTTVFFCDYASAGNEFRRDNYYRTWFPVEYGPTE